MIQRYLSHQNIKMKKNVKSRRYLSKSNYKTFIFNILMLAIVLDCKCDGLIAISRLSLGIVELKMTDKNLEMICLDIHKEPK